MDEHKYTYKIYNTYFHLDTSSPDSYITAILATDYINFNYFDFPNLSS